VLVTPAVITSALWLADFVEHLDRQHALVADDPTGILADLLADYRQAVKTASSPVPPPGAAA